MRNSTQAAEGNLYYVLPCKIASDGVVQRLGADFLAQSQKARGRFGIDTIALYEFDAGLFLTHDYFYVVSEKSLLSRRRPRRANLCLVKSITDNVELKVLDRVSYRVSGDDSP